MILIARLRSIHLDHSSPAAMQAMPIARAVRIALWQWAARWWISHRVTPQVMPIAAKLMQRRAAPQGEQSYLGITHRAP